MNSIYHNGTYRTRYLFNGKELDTETNLYYYGARYFEPKEILWYGCDPLREKYPFTSSYVYCNANPVKYVDPDGRKVAGCNQESADAMYEDVQTTLSDEKFKEVREMFVLKGKQFKKVDTTALNETLNGISLTED